MSENERKITVNDKDYNYDDLKQEQQILVEHIENCRRSKAQLAYNLDKETMAKLKKERKADLAKDAKHV